MEVMGRGRKGASGNSRREGGGGGGEIRRGWEGWDAGGRKGGS